MLLLFSIPIHANVGILERITEFTGIQPSLTLTVRWILIFHPRYWYIGDIDPPNCGMLRILCLFMSFLNFLILVRDTSVCSGDTLILLLPDAYFSYSGRMVPPSPTFSALQPGDYCRCTKRERDARFVIQFPSHFDTSTTRWFRYRITILFRCCGCNFDAGSGYDTYRWW